MVRLQRLPRLLPLPRVVLAAAAIVACSGASDEDEDSVVSETGQAVSESIPVGTSLYATSNVSLRASPFRTDQYAR